MILIFGVTPSDVAVGHPSLVSVEPRRESNDSFDFLHPGGKGGGGGGGRWLGFAGGPLTPRWESSQEQSCHPSPEYLYFAPACINFPLNFLCDHFV